MKITNKTLMVNFETEVKLGNNDAIELTLQHIAFISEKKDGSVSVDLDLGVDYSDVKFLGIDIEQGYYSFKEFKATLSKLGIDFDKLISEKEQELANSGIEEILGLMYKGRV
jgi:arginyl-tRNA synthetase